ncbi:hypothetical protein QVD17_01290 [Tagetes erecta]|uniref:Uncharacterized protein n=1 Tax=Tagetes erecta TaxID=13708 RepID=A0AAD8P1C6_TARER|nr:hypothetical protein QVD17_01290 [Tagetes erecta]
MASFLDFQMHHMLVRKMAYMILEEAGELCDEYGIFNMLSTELQPGGGGGSFTHEVAALVKGVCRDISSTEGPFGRDPIDKGAPNEGVDFRWHSNISYCDL